MRDGEEAEESVADGERDHWSCDQRLQVDGRLCGHRVDGGPVDRAASEVGEAGQDVQRISDQVVNDLLVLVFLDAHDSQVQDGAATEGVVPVPLVLLKAIVAPVVAALAGLRVVAVAKSLELEQRCSVEADVDVQVLDEASIAVLPFAWRHDDEADVLVFQLD